jgi:Flp pilus assembly protein TadG
MRCNAIRGSGGGSAIDRGSAPIEVVLLAPVLVLMIMLAVVGGTAASVRIEADAAAAAAARAASLQRDEGAAEAEAARAAEATLTERCLGPQLSVDADLTPGGTVTVTITCTVDTTGLPSFGTRTTTATAASPVDAWRAGPES